MDGQGWNSPDTQSLISAVEFHDIRDILRDKEIYSKIGFL